MLPLLVLLRHIQIWGGLLGSKLAADQTVPFTFAEYPLRIDHAASGQLSAFRFLNVPSLVEDSTQLDRIHTGYNVVWSLRFHP